MRKRWQKINLCLVGFAFDRMAPAVTAHAASETQPLVGRAGLSKKETVPPALSAQPVVFVATGLVCLLFGSIAVAPLLIGDPGRALREANRAGR